MPASGLCGRGSAPAASLATVFSWTAAGGSHHASTALLNLRSVGRLWHPATAYLLFAAGYIAYITFLSAYLGAARPRGRRRARAVEPAGQHLAPRRGPRRAPRRRYGTGATLAWTTALCAAALSAVTRRGDHRTPN